MEIIRRGLRLAIQKAAWHVGLVLALLSVLCVFANPQTQDAELASHLQQHLYELKLTEGRLDGPAAKWLREEASKVQFLFIGEEHDTHEIPLILTALWPELVPFGYSHVAIEAGQWLGGRLDRFARFQDQRALSQFKGTASPRRPNISVPPSSVEDIEFYANLGRPLQSGTRRGTPLIWGLDHEFKVAPLLKRLVELTLDPERRQQVTALLTKVETAERAGAYNMQPFKAEITPLIHAYTTRPGAESAQLLDALERRVFGNEFDQPRSDVFRQLFVQNYRAAQSAGEAKPRVLLRFGAWHAKRGLGRDDGYGPPTFANFVAEFASLEGGQMLNIKFVACSMTSTEDWRAPKSHPRPCSPSERVWLKPFFAAASSSWTIFDLRALRQPLREGKINVEQEIGQLIAGFDALVLLKESMPAHFSR